LVAFYSDKKIALVGRWGMHPPPPGSAPGDVVNGCYFLAHPVYREQTNKHAMKPQLPSSAVLKFTKRTLAQSYRHVQLTEITP